MALLGIECGGTHTTVALSDSSSPTEPTATFQLGPGNFRLTTADGYAALFVEAFAKLEVDAPPAAIGLAVAGVRAHRQPASWM
jgi:predicted NBD/HSP70 family sugar kinase